MSHVAGDREEAFAYYASLPVTERSLRRVAERFGISHSRAKEWSAECGWVARIRVLEEEARARTDELVLASWERRKRDTLIAIDQTRKKYLAQLSDPEFVIRPGEMAQLLRQEAAYEGEATDRVLVIDHQAELRAVASLALQFMDADQGRAFLAALAGEVRALTDGEVVDAEAVEETDQEGGEAC